ncbi:MAG: hypothetical protein NC311_12900 [Muribaculaceae bacterium]|nr:hypothetical protein [Muribaculaceae bacterium]
MKYGREEIPCADDLNSFECGQRKTPCFATRRGQEVSAAILIIVAAVVLVLKMSASAGSVSYAMDGSALGVACKDHAPVFIAYSEIQEIVLCTAFPMGEAVTCADWDSGWCGTYRSEELGEYTLFAYSGVGEFIMVRTAGELLIFNAGDQKTTEDLYEQLLQKAAVHTESGDA